MRVDELSSLKPSTGFLCASGLSLSAKDRRVAVCVCTYKRPRLLEACLHSLSNLNVPPDFLPTVVVIDNDISRSAEPVIDRFKAFKFSLVYVIEPRRGISVVRNRALRAAKELDAGWLAFIDDDEVAHPDWLVGLMHKDYLSTPILAGLQILKPPDPRPFWYMEGGDPDHREGRYCTTAAANNVRFRMSVFEVGLRFDEQLALSGGEDTEFFFAAYCNGFVIQKTCRAITYEVVHRERTGYFRQCSRALWIAAVSFRRDAAKFGRVRATIKRLHTVPVGVLGGVALIIVSPVALLAGRERFKRVALLGGRKVGKGIGRLLAMFGHMPQPYARVDGA